MKTDLLRVLVSSGLLLWSSAAAAPQDAADVSGRVRTGHDGTPNVVVWLEAPGAPRAPHRAVLDQRNLRFFPTVLVTSVGSTIEFPNNDRVLHNVFSFKDGKQFDLGLYPVGRVRQVTFDQPGVSRVFCNIHPGMAAYVVVVDSPYFAVTDAEGAFTLRGVPRGTYRYRAWRAGANVVSDTVLVGPDTPLEIQWPTH